MRREKKKLASDVLILPFRIQKRLPPNTSHLGNNGQAKDGKFLQNSAIDRVMVAKTLPWLACASDTELNKYQRSRKKRGRRERCRKGEEGGRKGGRVGERKKGGMGEGRKEKGLTFPTQI